MYTAILFDLDGTLIDFDACVRDAVRGTFAHAGLDVDDRAAWDRVWAAYEPAATQHWGNRAETGWSRAQVVEQTLRDTLAVLGSESDRAPELAHRYWDLFCQANRLNPGARETLEQLQGRFKLGLVTNGERDSQRGRLRATGLAGYLEATIISDEAGCAKPDPRIFELALTALGVRAAEALYVGDSIAHDLVGARNAGIDFCYYQPDAAAQPEVQPTMRISHLSELVELLTVHGQAAGR
jgi:YjjG family noncanonical pyrimidine nucleotidase